MSKLEEQKALPRRRLFRNRLTTEQRAAGWVDLPEVFDVLDPRHPLAKPKPKPKRKAKKAKRK